MAQAVPLFPLLLSSFAFPLNGQYPTKPFTGKQLSVVCINITGIESVIYWVREYHVDGFRFDLMAIHGMETMNQVEMKRTKGGEHNSFNKPDSVKRINWNWKYENKNLYTYYQQLIALRKAHPAFRMPSAEMIRKHLVFLPVNDPQLIAFQLKDHANGDSWNQIVVIFNGSDIEKQVILPDGTWKTALLNYRFETNPESLSKEARVAPYSATILYR
jgi:pullulanase/glycogen debranching enzyme